MIHFLIFALSLGAFMKRIFVGLCLITFVLTYLPAPTFAESLTINALHAKRTALVFELPDNEDRAETILFTITTR